MAYAIEFSGERQPLVADRDQDSLHTLSCGILPLRGKAFRKLRLIKNVRMETRIELYRESGMGSGQIAIDELPSFMTATDDLLHRDMPLLEKVGEMESFDPYSLRRGLRAAGIEVEDHEAFRLSDAKRRELQPHMRQLTRPLARYIFGSQNVELSDPETIRARLLNADGDAVRMRVDQLAHSLQTERTELPAMLEDYGDVFLSLGLYKHHMGEIAPRIERLQDWLDEAVRVPHIANDPVSGPGVRKVIDLLGALLKSLKRRFRNFDTHTQIHWERVTVSSFNQVRQLITDHQESLAAVLCGLSVKIFEWEERFPGGGGSFERRVEMAITDLRAGLDRLAVIEHGANRFD